MNWLSFFLPRPIASAANVPVVANISLPVHATRIAPEARNDDASLLALYATVDTDAGLPIVDPNAILRFFESTIEDTRHMLGVGEVVFQEQCWPVLLALAKYLQTLPATRTAHFRRPLGAMRRAVMMGRACARAATAVIFDPDATQSDRKLLQTHWRVGCWVAGVCSELGYLVDQLEVVACDGEAWHPVSESQTDWAHRLDVDRIWIRWRTAKSNVSYAPSTGSDAYLAARVIPPSVLAFLHSGSGEIARVVLDCISGSSGSRGRTLFNLVASARSAIANADIQSDPTHYGKPLLGIVLPEFVVAAMRDCITERIWSVNERMSAVFHTPHGLFIKWPYAAREIRARLAHMRVAPTPAEPEQLLEALADAGLIVPPPGAGLAAHLWTIEPDCLAKPIAAIKLKGPHVLCGDTEPWPQIACRVTLPREARENHQPVVTACDPESDVVTIVGESPDRPKAPRKRKTSDEAHSEQSNVGSSADVAPTTSEGVSQENASPSPEWRTVIDNDVSVRDRVILNRVLLHAKVTGGQLLAVDFSRSSIPFAVAAGVLSGINAIESQTEDALTLARSFVQFLESYHDA